MYHASIIQQPWLNPEFNKCVTVDAMYLRPA
jgi:hypothetical protein